MTDLIDPAKLFGEIGLPLDPACSFNKWLGGLCFAVAGWKDSSWRVADMLNHPHAATKEGEQAIEEILKLAGLDDRADKTFENIAGVGRKFPPETRKKEIPFTFYSEARALPLAEALRLVESADSAKAIREAVHAGKNGSNGTRKGTATAIAMLEARIAVLEKGISRALDDYCGCVSCPVKTKLREISL